MKKAEIIKIYGEEAYKKRSERSRAWYYAHKEGANARSKKYYEEHPEKAKVAVKKYNDCHPEQLKATHNEQNRKGGKHYEHTLEDNRSGLRGERNAIRHKDGKKWRPYKNIIAPDSQIHHEWVPLTAEYTGVALVEADAHIHGFIDVIEILDGKITLLTEEEVKEGKKKRKENDI